MSLALFEHLDSEGRTRLAQERSQKRPLPQEGDDKGQVPLAHKGEWDKLLFQSYFT